MPPDIRWITPLYGFGSDCEHIGVPENARAPLLEMSNELVGRGAWLPSISRKEPRISTSQGKCVAASSVLFVW